MPVNTGYINSTRGTSSEAVPLYSLHTLYLLTWCTSVEFIYVPCSYLHNVPLVEFMYLVFTRMMYLCWVHVPCIYLHDVLLVEFMYIPGESYHRQLKSLLLCLCDAFQVLTPWCVGVGLVLFQITTKTFTCSKQPESCVSMLWDRPVYKCVLRQTCV